ncbi:MAG: C39 family peptidase, partial [Thermoguttaceae bacterium]|nr:C39 family peptidase [Thermoguttaceae bacterium]
FTRGFWAKLRCFPIICAASAVFAVEPDEIRAKPGAKLIDVPYMHQLDVVFGCEAVSATMVLQFHGLEIGWKEFTDDFLIKKPWRVDEAGNRFGPCPFSAYPGDPYRDEGPNCGYGCYAPALVKSMNAALRAKGVDDVEAVVTNGMKLVDLVANFIDAGEPALVWATMDMAPARLTSAWTIDYVDENSPYRIGDKFVWNGNEHCLVLVGYDAENYYFNDPYKNHGLIGYEKNLVEARFREQGAQSAAIRPKK